MTRDALKLLRLRETGIFLAFVVLCLVTALLNPNFLSPNNLRILSRRIAIYSILAMGETLVIITQGIDLSPGRVIILIGVVCAWLLEKGAGVVASLTLSLGVAGLIGLWHGVFVTQLSVPPFVITLGTYLMAKSGAEVITGGGTPINISNAVLSFVGRGWGGTVPALVLLVLAIFAWLLLRFTVVGRHVFAIGGNIEAARLSGVPIHRRRIQMYVLCSVAAGVTGILIAAYLRQGQVNLNEPYELFAIAGAVIGGTSLFGGEGSIPGTVIGAAILGVINNILIFWNVPSYWQNMVIGLILVLAVTLDVLRRRGDA